MGKKGRYVEHALENHDAAPLGCRQGNDCFFLDSQSLKVRKRGEEGQVNPRLPNAGCCTVQVNNDVIG